MSILETFMNSMGVNFKNQRTGQIIEGVKNTYKNQKILQFYPDTDLQIGDTVIFVQTFVKT